MAGEHVRVVPVRVRLEDDDLRTTRLRVIGYAATNGYDWTGPTRGTRQDAVADMAARRAEAATRQV